MMSDQFYGTGRRKTSVARVILLPGQGTFTVNGKDIEDYFGYETLKELAKSPLKLVEKLGEFDVKVNVKGGGFTGQAGAIRHGVARALVELDEELKPVLKRAGFLTRDSRKKERKKPG
ncbi:30S ribosomal protein S9, partial [Rhodovulum adriaticum]|nr:30S ribosomal protein S9 [Rhodovulum adriaticum]